MVLDPFHAKKMLVGVREEDNYSTEYLRSYSKFPFEFTDYTDICTNYRHIFTNIFI